MFRPVIPYSGPGRLLRMDGDDGGPAVLITHGTFSNADTCAPLAGALAAAGYDVYVSEWRGRDGRPGRFDFHDLADGEISAALKAMPRRAHLVADSGGGLAMAMALVDPQNRARVRSLTMIATQATHLTQAAVLPYAGVRMLDACARIYGHWPAALLRLGPCNETAALLGQWVRFNRARMIWLRDGSDLLPRLERLELPAFALAGAGDRVIARADGCRALVNAFGPTARFHLCDARSDGEDFTHSRVFRSRAAAASVWPRIVEFMRSADAR